MRRAVAVLAALALAIGGAVVASTSTPSEAGPIGRVGGTGPVELPVAISQNAVPDHTAQDVLLVPPNSPFRSVQELIDYAKAYPGELNYASLGTGTSGHLATVMFADLAGITLQHVPYTSVSQAATDVMSGRIAVFLPTLGGHIGNVTAGRMRALAVSGPARAAQLPDVPTFSELGVKFVDETSWYALFAPKGTPKEIIGKVNTDVERILALLDVKEKAVTLGYRYVGGSPQKLDAFLKHEIAKWAEVAKSASLK